MMKKLFASIALVVSLLVAGTAAADSFRAIGGSNRHWDGSRLVLRSLESGRTYTFFGTGRSCPGRYGAPYDSMSWVMNGNPFNVSVQPCGNGMVWVCAADDYNNSSCSGYSVNYEGGFRYW